MEDDNSQFFNQMHEKDFLSRKVHSVDDLQQKYSRVLADYLIKIDYQDNFENNQLKFFNRLFDEITIHLDQELKHDYQPYFKPKLNCLLELIQLGRNSKFIQEKSVQWIQKIIELLVIVVKNMELSEITEFKYILDSLHSNYLLNDFVNHIKSNSSKKRSKIYKDSIYLYEQQVLQILGYYQNYNDNSHHQDVKLVFMIKDIIFKLMNLAAEQTNLLDHIFELLFRSLMFDISSQSQPRNQYDLHRHIFSQLQLNIQNKFKKFLNKMLAEDVQQEDKLKMSLGGIQQIFIFNQQIVLDMIPEINGLLKKSQLRIVFFLQMFQKAPIQFSQNYPNFYKEILNTTLTKNTQNQEFIFMKFIDIYKTHNNLFKTRRQQILTKEEQEKVNILISIEDHLYDKILMQDSDCSYQVLKQLFKVFKDSQYNRYTFSDSFVQKQLCPLVYQSNNQEYREIIYKFMQDQFKQMFSQYYDKQQHSFIEQRQIGSQNQQNYDNIYLNHFILSIYNKLMINTRIYYYDTFVGLFMNGNKVNRLVGLCLNMNYDDQNGYYNSDYLKIDNFYSFIFKNFSKLESCIDDPCNKHKHMMDLYQCSKNFKRVMKSLNMIKGFFYKLVQNNDKEFQQKLVESMQQLMPQKIRFEEVLDEIMQKQKQIKKIMNSSDQCKKEQIMELFDNDKIRMIINVMVIDDISDQELDSFIEQIFQQIKSVQYDINMKQNLLVLYSQIMVLGNVLKQFIELDQSQQLRQMVDILIQVKGLLIMNYNEIMKSSIFINQGDQNDILLLINYKMLDIFEKISIIDDIMDHQLLDELEKHLIELVQLKQLNLKIQKKAMYLLIDINRVREDDSVQRLLSKYKLSFNEKMQDLKDVKNKLCLFYCCHRKNDEDLENVEINQLLEINGQILNSMVPISKQDLISQESILKNYTNKLCFYHLYQHSGLIHSIELRQKYTEMLFDMIVYNDLSFKEIYQSDFVYLKYKLLKPMIQILKHEKNKNIINKVIIAIGLTIQNRYIILSKILYTLMQQNIKDKDLLEYQIQFISIYYLLVLESDDEFKSMVDHYLVSYLKIYSKKMQKYKQVHKLKYKSIESCYEFVLIELTNFAMSLPNLYLDKFNTSNVYQIFQYFIKNYKNNLNNSPVQTKDNENIGHNILNILFSYMIFHQPVLVVDKDRFSDHFRTIGKTIRKNQMDKSINHLLEFEKINQQQINEIANKFNEGVGINNIGKMIYLLKYGVLLKIVYQLISNQIGDIIEQPKQQKYQYKFKHHNFRKNDDQEQIYILKVFQDQVYLVSVLNTKTKSKDLNSTMNSLKNNSNRNNRI